MISAAAQCRMDYMRSQFSRILLAQVVAVLVALLVVTVITRASLGRGFKDFLKTQEDAVLKTLVPTFADFYETRGNWDFLRDDADNWMRIWRLSRSPKGEPRFRGGRQPANGFIPGSPGESQLLRWMRQPERGMLRDRLFLLDENRSWIAGNERGANQTGELEAITVGGQAVGWLGFAPMGSALPPEAARFMQGQIRFILISFIIALVVAVALAYLLARTVSRPVRELGETVGRLSRGDYLARAPVAATDEIGVLATHVNELAKTLEKNRTARQRWMADIAHELRTPVAILKGEAAALTDGIRPPDKRFVSSLKEEIDQLSRLIDDVQTLALSDAGALNLQKTGLDIGHMVRQSVDAYRDRLAERGILLETQLPVAVEIVADPTRTRQLLHNLLENSCRYVVDGGKVRISLSASDGKAHLVLEDSGPGLTSDQIARLFDRFYRVEQSRTRSRGGAGLGLAICRNIVEAHGGTIRAEPSAMGGLSISVALPI